jgi:hypothetical protein
LNDPAIKENMKKLAAEPMMLTPAEFDRFVRAECRQAYAAFVGRVRRSRNPPSPPNACCGVADYASLI